MRIQQYAGNSVSKQTGEVIRAGMSVRPAGLDDLAVINAIVTGAMETWGLSQRVQRLAQRSLTYTKTDFHFMLAALGVNNEGREIAVALWEPETRDSCAHSSILLHGIYVMPENQRCGIGAKMVEHVENIVSKDGFGGIIVKAWRDSEEFFLKAGFLCPQYNEQEDLYPRRLWKPV